MEARITPDRVAGDVHHVPGLQPFATLRFWEGAHHVTVEMQPDTLFALAVLARSVAHELVTELTKPPLEEGP